jgi:hypothetical protein
MKSFFYRVAWGQETGIDPVILKSLLSPGRMIRWRSSVAEYGLIEAVLTDTGYNHMIVRDNGTSRSDIISIEQIAEISLIQEEAQNLNLGWPNRCVRMYKEPL